MANVAMSVVSTEAADDVVSVMPVMAVVLM